MTLDPEIREEAYAYFLSESQDLLRTIENELFELRDDPSKGRIHALMRATHTLKGASANVGLETIKTIAHHMEDVFRALFEPEAVIDVELEGLLLELYDCLRLALTGELENEHHRDEQVLEQAIDTFASIQGKLGDCFGRETALPSSAELGFDIVKSIFESGVLERIDQLAELVDRQNQPALAETLASQAEIFAGLGESLGLPGFTAIAQAVTAAIGRGAEPLALGRAALADWQAAQTAVMAGDRHEGGQVSPALATLAGQTTASSGGSTSSGPTIAAPTPAAAQPAAPEIPEIIDEADQILDLSDDDLGDFDLGTVFSQFGLTPAPASPSPIAVPPPAPAPAAPAPPMAAPLAPRPEAKPQIQTQARPETKPAAPAAERVESRPIAASTPLIRVELDRLQELQHLVGELLINENRQSLQDEQLQVALTNFRSQLRQHRRTLSQLRDRLGDVEETSPRARSIEPNSRAENFKDLATAVRDQADRLEATAEVVERYAQQTNQSMEKQRRLLGNVRDSLMEVRMQPISVVFDRFPPLIRQMSARYGKLVQLRLVGERVSIDKAAIEQLYDPLLHLVRNAFDHGIEAPDQRRDQGKPETGTIELRAVQQGNQVLISIADDGNGIDPDRVREKAVSLGWLTADQADRTPPSGLYDFLFEPGFSTARQVTDLSGRGVGLDVVKSQLKSLKGSVSIQSVRGQGTVFLMRIPLSLMTARLLICQADRATYALPSDNISQILIPQPDQTQMLGGQRVLRWQQGEEPEMTIPVRKLSDMMRYHAVQPGRLLPSRGEMAPFLSNRLAPLMLIESETGLVAIEVDGVVGEQELVLRQLSEAIPSPDYLYGCTILGDGRMVLVVDAPALMARANVAPAFIPSSAPPALAEPTNPPANTPKTNELAAEPASPALVAGSARSGQGPSLSAAGADTDRSIDPAPTPTAAPVPTATAPTLPTIPATPTAIAGKTLLLVEDSETERRIVSRLLENAGYQVVQACHGREALTALQQTKHIDLILSDLEMPEMGGLEFLNARRQVPKAANVPVVMLTSCSGKQYRQVATSLGAADYLTKPHDRDLLLATIQRLTKA